MPSVARVKPREKKDEGDLLYGPRRCQLSTRMSTLSLRRSQPVEYRASQCASRIDMIRPCLATMPAAWSSTGKGKGPFGVATQLTLRKGTGTRALQRRRHEARGWLFHNSCLYPFSKGFRQSSVCEDLLGTLNVIIIIMCMWMCVCFLVFNTTRGKKGLCFVVVCSLAMSKGMWIKAGGLIEVALADTLFFQAMHAYA